MRRALPVLAFAASLAFAAPARADVPFHDVWLDNALEVTGQEKFPDWVVIVFPSALPAGLPAAKPALVEPGYHSEIDRKVLGTPKLWILPRSALVDLQAAAAENDNQVEGPVAKLLKERGVECLDLSFEEKTAMPFTVPLKGKLYTYALENAAAGQCAMKFVKSELYTDPEYKRGRSWAAFLPKKKKKDAGAPTAASAAPATSASAAPSAAAAPSDSAAPAAPSASSPAPRTEPPVPEPSRASGCGCAVIGGGEGERPMLPGLLLALAAVARRARPGGSRRHPGG